MNLRKFFSKYADEVAGIAGAIQAILPAVPIGSQDKAKVDAIIEQLETAATNVAKAAKNAPTSIDPKVTVKKSDVEAAVAAYLDKNPRIIADAVEAEFAKAKAEAGNGNASA